MGNALDCAGVRERPVVDSGDTPLKKYAPCKYLPIQVNGTPILQKEEGNQWRATNKFLQSDGFGIAYRRKKRFDARMPDQTLEWEKTIEAEDEGDGWVRITQAGPQPDYEVKILDSLQEVTNEIQSLVGQYWREGEHNGKPYYQKGGGGIFIYYQHAWCFGTGVGSGSTIALADSDQDHIPKNCWQTPKRLFCSPQDIPLAVVRLKKKLPKAPDAPAPSAFKSCFEGCFSFMSLVTKRSRACCNHLQDVSGASTASQKTKPKKVAREANASGANGASQKQEQTQVAEKGETFFEKGHRLSKQFTSQLLEQAPSMEDLEGHGKSCLEGCNKETFRSFMLHMAERAHIDCCKDGIHKAMGHEPAEKKDTGKKTSQSLSSRGGVMRRPDHLHDHDAMSYEEMRAMARQKTVEIHEYVSQTHLKLKEEHVPVFLDKTASCLKGIAEVCDPGKSKDTAATEEARPKMVNEICETSLENAGPKIVNEVGETPAEETGEAVVTAVCEPSMIDAEPETVTAVRASPAEETGEPVVIAVCEPSVIDAEPETVSDVREFPAEETGEPVVIAVCEPSMINAEPETVSDVREFPAEETGEPVVSAVCEPSVIDAEPETVSDVRESPAEETGEPVVSAVCEPSMIDAEPETVSDVRESPAEETGEPVVAAVCEPSVIDAEPETVIDVCDSPAEEAKPPSASLEESPPPPSTDAESPENLCTPPPPSTDAESIEAEAGDASPMEPADIPEVVITTTKSGRL
jgi:hypothetical protein